MWFRYQPATKLPTPGAMSMALVTEWLAHKPWIGAGIVFETQMRSFNTQNEQQVSMTTTTGLGGIVHGQNVLQPLSDPYGDGT